MNRLVTYVFCGVFFCIVGRQVVASNCELKARINKAFRELPIVEELKHRSHRALGGPPHAPPHASPHAPRPAHAKRTHRQSIPQLARNIESFLQKLIPNHNLVQDLMGYITMPNPSAHRNRHR